MTELVLEYLSPTQIGRLQACEQRYAFKYIDGGDEPGSEPMATGIGFAEALEKRDVATGITAYLEARPPVDEVWDDAEVRENERLVAESTIRHAYAGYLTRYADPDVEREVEYIVQTRPDGPVLYVRADGAGPVYMVEDKLRSGSSLGAEKIEMECKNGHQLTAEIWVRWKRTGELMPVKFRLMRKPDRRKTKALKLDAAAIDLLVAEHFETNEKAYDERTVTRTLEDMARFERELYPLWAKRANLHRGHQPVRNSESCFSFGRVCPFAGKCHDLSNPSTTTADVACK